MGKFFLYVTIALIIAFTANFFGIVSIPWLNVPFATDKSYYTKDIDKNNEAVKELFEDEQK